MTLATRVLLGLALGVLVGLFFGPEVGFLGPIGDAFIRLLQMTVLPYIMVSLIGGLGTLSYTMAGRLARSAGGFLLVLWGMALLTVLVAPLAYPDWPSASFFSHTLIDGSVPQNLLSLYIPANPFHAMAETVVPAVVLFTIAVGIALIGVEDKTALLESLRALSDTITRVMNFVVGLAPYGVFAIAANAAGTMEVGDARGLYVYLAVYIAMALILALWALPALAAMLTPFSHRQILSAGRAALITAFATGSVFVVLPVLATRTKELLATADASEDAIQTVDVVVPTAFNLPSAGKLLTLSFVVFAGWISGFPVSPTEYPSLLATGLVSLVGSTFVAMPFLLNLFQIPADTFRLFVVADQMVGGRFGALVGATHILVLSLLAASALGGRLRVKPARAARFAIVTGLAVVATLGGVRLLANAVGHGYDTYELFIQRDHLLPVALVRTRSEPQHPLPTRPPGGALERARARGFVRVGYAPDALPFAFTNGDGSVVGFDMEMAHTLARDLGVDLELVRVPRERREELIDTGYLDVFMSGAVITPLALESFGVTQPYLEETLAFVVPDHRREDFRRPEKLRALEAPRIAVPATPYYVGKLERFLPQAELVVIQSLDTFFEAEPGAFDALLYTAEAGASWSLIHPRFTVAVPTGAQVSVPAAYLVARDDVEMLAFLNGWIELKRHDRTLERLHEYWIQGKTPLSKKAPRWSIVRNVLGWVD